LHNLESIFKIADVRDEIEAQAKASAPVAVAFSHNAELFEPAENVFVGGAKFGGNAVVKLVLLAQRAVFRAFQRQQRVGMYLDDADETAVSKSQSLGRDVDFRLLVHSEIVCSTFAERCADDLIFQFVHHD